MCRHTSVILAALHTAVYFSAWPAMASTAEFEMNLSDELQRLAIAPTAVTVASVIVTQADADWMTGSNHDIDLQKVTISAQPGVQSRDIGLGLKVHYDPLQSPPIRAESCRTPQDDCTSLAVVGTGSRATISLEGNHYQLDFYGTPCKKALSCSLYFASWQLHKAVEALAGRGTAFPRYVAVLDTPDSLLFVDLERKINWMSLGKTSINAMVTTGTATAVRYDGEGGFTVTYPHAQLLLDFATDQALLMTGSQLFLADKPLAGLETTKFRSLATVSHNNDASRSEGLYLDRRQAIWSAHAVFAPHLASASYLEITELPDSMRQVATYRGEIYGLSARDGKINHWQLHGRQFRQIQSFPQLANLSYYQLVGASVFVIRENSTKLLRPTGELSTSIDHVSSIVQTNGQAVTQRSDGTSCTYIHLSQNRDDSAAFKDSGISMDCADFDGFSSNDDHALVFGYRNAILRAKAIHDL